VTAHQKVYKSCKRVPYVCNKLYNVSKGASTCSSSFALESGKFYLFKPHYLLFTTLFLLIKNISGLKGERSGRKGNAEVYFFSI